MPQVTIPASKIRHILLWSTAILYFLSSPSIYYHLFTQQEGKPIEKLYAPLKEKGEIKYNLESLIYWPRTRVAPKEGELYAFKGWAFINEGPHIRQDEYDRFVVVYNESNAYLFPMKDHSRPDVQKAFQKLGLSNLKSSGFHAVISRNALSVGKYKIGLLFRSQGDGPSYYRATNKILERTPNHLLLLPKL